MVRKTLMKQNWSRRQLVLVGIALAAGWGSVTVQAVPLGQATITETNNDVRYQAANAAERPAKPKDVVRGADLLRTGQKSQAELQFEDKTITRLGSNSLFTFDPEKRDFDLRQGVLMFDMPKGNGGGRIRSAGITAAIEGTAGFVIHGKTAKVFCLAGAIRILDAKGHQLALLKPGEAFIDGKVYQISLSGLKKGKLLRNGLPNNQAEFDRFAAEQLVHLKDGTLLLVSDDVQPPPPYLHLLPGLQGRAADLNPPPVHHPAYYYPYYTYGP